MDTNKQYSVLTYNIGGYEKIHPILKKSPNAEYIYVTDDTSIKSDDWTVVYVPKCDDGFEGCFNIRYNPFDFVHTDIVVKIDGSMTVSGDLDEIIEAFNIGNYDCCVEVHPSRCTMIEEYSAWVKIRGYDINQANKCLLFLQNGEGYDVKNHKGLYQYNFMIQRRNKMNMDWNRMTYALLKYLAPEGKSIDRLDQTIGSFVLNKYFKNSNVMVVDSKICDGSYLTWYAHNSDTKLKVGGQQCTPYLFNEEPQIHRFGFTISENLQ